MPPKIVYRPKTKPAPQAKPPSSPTPTKIVKSVRKPKGPVGFTRYWQDKLKGE